MSAWSTSPYRGVGIYIGGVNSACAQPNLTAAWVAAEVAAGWHLIPTYVGYQGGGACGGSCSSISPAGATAEGRAAADDAIAHAQALGIAAGNPIYDDMEQYRGGAVNTGAVLAYLAGWTDELHAQGYLSGVYSSGASAISDLVRRVGTSYAEPDDIWVADWNGRPTTTDPYLPSADWPGPHRIHQYQGGHDESHGGVTLNIDDDSVNADTADTASPLADGTFVRSSAGPTIYRLAGGAPLPVTSWAPFGGPHPVTTLSARRFAALAPHPADGTVVQIPSGPLYRFAGGAPIALTSWAVFGTPLPDVVIDPWDLENGGNPRSHVLAVPANGTVVQGLPSDSYWVFNGGLRQPATATATATEVDDAGLLAFPEGLGPSTTVAGAGAATLAPADECVVPRLTHMTLPVAGVTLQRGGCALGRVTQPRRVPAGHVLRVAAQSPRPGTRQPAGVTVALTLR